MKKILFIGLVSILFFSCQSSIAVSSPDGTLILRFAQTEDGGIGYRVSRDNNEIIAFSPLGFLTENQSLENGFFMVGTKKKNYSSVWETVWGEERFIEDRHNELLVSLRHESGMLMDIEFRVFDDGFAFRYLFPEQGEKTLTITDELTAYRFTQDAEAWSIPWRTEYYEGLWQKRTLNDPMAKCLDTLCSPITIEFADGTYGFVHEAALTDYPAQNLYVREGALRTYLTPWLEQNLSPTLPSREGEIKAYVEAPFSTPWRLVVLTKTLPELVASRIMLNLNEPCKIEDTSWIRPMKFMGIWWGMHIKTMTWEQGPNHGATTENMERYMRFAKEHGIGAVLAEGWNKGWEDWKHFDFTTPYDDWDMDYLSRLSDSLGVQIVGHNETGGNAADYEQDLDAIYRYHEANGIRVIKTGYVAPIIRTVDGLQWNKGQSGVRHYRKVIETAAKYHIAIDNHEPVMPTGLQRTYPNLMSQEGVRGQEWNAWSTDGGSPCEHVTVLPYTRILAGPVDYTPGVFRFENPIIPTTRVHSTLMNQLGLFVCFYSPLQMACDLPEHYMEHPDAFRFIESVPCDWERSILVDGKIGDFCVFARQERGTDNWYIGGITDEEAREVTIPLTFLNNPSAISRHDHGLAIKYKATLYRDAEDADWETRPYAYNIEDREVTADDTIRVRMAPGGGFAMELKINQ
ncbi:MAG: glycoside hydrolase family 97 protein [Paludibacteraceae bacterium]|nr:glycoside hydrolase family 97 protein [Paludibacteraceae bacterium]